MLLFFSSFILWDFFLPVFYLLCILLHELSWQRHSLRWLVRGGSDILAWACGSGGGADDVGCSLTSSISSKASISWPSVICGRAWVDGSVAANSPWWHHKSGFSSLKHGGRQMLGFKSECLNPKHEEWECKMRRWINVKADGMSMQSVLNVSSLLRWWGGGLFIGQLRGRFSL
jgi:hypothetical protein